MSDRLTEIRARLDAATPGEWPMGALVPYLLPSDADHIAHAPADIAWLLDEVERVTNERDIAKKWLLRWRRAAWEARARKAAE